MTKIRFVALAACLCSGGAAGCGGEDGAEVTPRRVGQAIADGTIDADTTGVLGILLSARGQWLFQCTGALVAPNVVLTAGHCVLAWDPSVTTEAAACDGDASPRLASPDDIVVVSGVDADQNAYHVERIAIPSTSADSSGQVLDLCSRDLGLLVLKAPIPASEAQRLELRTGEAANPGDAFAAVGFGAGEPMALSTEVVRRRASGTVDCVASGCSPDEGVRDGEWQSQDVFACPGDSGSPALDDDGAIIGVVSRGYGDCHGVIYEDVAHFADFLGPELAAARAPVTAERDAAVARCTLGIDRDHGGRSPFRPALAAAGFALAALTRRLRRARAG